MLSRFTTVVITGGSSGIGKSFLEHMSRLHGDLRICNLSRSAPKLSMGQLKLRHVPCDLSDRSSTSAAAVEVLEFLNAEGAHGEILLVNNSGFGAYGSFPEPDAPRLSEMIEVNVGSLIELTARLLPVLRVRGGAIVNVASTAAFQPTAFLATYGASKAFVLHWSLALREELRGSGVHVLTLCPGPTDTDFFRRAGLAAKPPGGTVSADFVVDAALRGLAARRTLVVPGWKNRLVALVTGCLPRTWSARLAAMVLARVRRP